MFSQDTIEKSYYQQLMPGHYIDVKIPESDWKLAKITDKQNRYLTIIYDALDQKQQQVFIGSFRVAPLRTHTQGYTGSSLKSYRNLMISIKDLKFHLEMMQKKFIQLPEGTNESAFELTQYLRGQLFVCVHSILCLDTQLKPDQISQLMYFFKGLISFIVKACQKCVQYSKQYFQISATNKLAHLSHPRIGLIYSLQQLLILLGYFLKKQNPRCINIFKQISQEQLSQYILLQKKIIPILSKIYQLNDNNGKWFPINVRKNIFKLLLQYQKKLQLPKYLIKDFLEVFQIFPFMIEISSNKQFQQQYLKFMVKILMEQSPFQAKLKSLAELKKILQKQMKLDYFQPNNVLELITESNILEYMLDQYNFNPQIFKRFVPILSFYCKSKSLTQKQISSLFKLTVSRHQSQMSTIYQIVTQITQIAPIDYLDSIFNDICQLEINNDQTLDFIKNFTKKAVKSQLNSKSFFSSFFGKKTPSSKFGYYGLNLLYNQVQDQGRITKNYVQIALEMIRQLFNQENFHPERQNYLNLCITQLEKKKSFGQSIKIISGIVSSYPTTALFGETRKQIVQKFDAKNAYVETVMKVIKNHNSINFQKVVYEQTLKYFYHFLQEFSDHLKYPIRIQHIQYLWTQAQLPLLMDFLKKNKPLTIDVEQNWKKKYSKKLDSTTIKQILSKIITKKSFYDRQLSQLEFQTIDDLFLSYHYTINNIDINDKETIRYYTTNLIGIQFYINTLIKCKGNKLQQIATKRLIQLHLRPKQDDNKQKIINWKKLLMQIITSLSNQPQKCLKILQNFFNLIQGRQFKDHVYHQGNLDIIVQCQGVQKTITLVRNSTIYRFRKLIMGQFDLRGDFIIHNIDMKKDISFIQEQDYSVNAMPLKQKGPSILIKNIKQQLHPHAATIKQFRQQLASEQKLYSILFTFLNQQPNLHKQIWAILQKLPFSQNFLSKVKKCSDLNRDKWTDLLCVKSKQQLEYLLNIILDFMKNNDLWVLSMFQTQGFSVIQQLFIKNLSSFNNQNILIKLCKIILKGLETIDRKNLKIEQLNKSINIIISTLKKWFILDKYLVSFELLNDLLNLLLKSCKITKFSLQKSFLEDQLIFRLLQFGLFNFKTEKINQNVSQNNQTEQILINIVLTQLGSLQNRILILERLILTYLNLQYLEKNKSNQNYFLFLIDLLHSLTIDQQSLVFKNESLKLTINKFISQILNNNYQDQSKWVFNQLNFGALKIINYLNNSSLKQQNQIFQKIVQQFLLMKDKKRIKHQKTKKLVYQVIKKMIYSKPQRLQKLIKQILPRLQTAQWRKNTYSSWVLESEKYQKKLFCGLQNLTATCYINCLFQQLFMISTFRQNFLSIDSRNYKQGIVNNQIYQLQKIFATLKYSNKKSCNTRNFCQSFITYQGRPIDPTIQSDADQFFNTLMEKIQFFLKENQSSYILESTFQGKLSNQLNCQGCPHKSQKEQNFLSIGINIKNKKTLSQALLGYVDGEILDGDNAYFCQTCQKKVRTTKRLCIKQLPNILVIVLKRFQFNYDQMRKIKINHQLKYPQELDMKGYTSQFLAKEKLEQNQFYKYGLRGVVIHSGTSQGGHYYSFIKDQAKWFQFNDQMISETQYRRVQDEGFGGDYKDVDGEFKHQKYKNAYILFYQKNNKKVIPQKIVQENNSFEPFLKDLIDQGNSNSDFMSFMLDPTFVRFCQNLAILDNLVASKFSLLYFHIVVLRDKNRDQYVANFYRILQGRLQNGQLADWFIKQINHRFIKQWYIQAPKVIRYITLGLLLKAMKAVKQISDIFFQTIIFCLKKKGMTPFTKIFSLLSQNEGYLKKLVQLQYPQRVLNYLIEKKENVAGVICESVDSYFGGDSSQKQKDTDFCSSSLVESLKNFDIAPSDCLKILQLYNSFQGNKICAKLLTKKSLKLKDVDLNIQQLKIRIIAQDFKRQAIQKYMYVFNQYCLIEDQQQLKRMEIVMKNIAKLISQMQAMYDPFQLILNQMNKFAGQYFKFAEEWINYLEKDALTRRIILDWVKQSDKGHYLSKSDQWKKKLLGLVILINMPINKLIKQ